MNRQEYLRPHDVCVLLQLALQPDSSFRHLSDAVGLSLGETHNAAKRLELARLVALAHGSVNVSGILEFVSAGVPYAFPAQIGAPVRGIPTAHSAAPLSDESPVGEAVVWPNPNGTLRGQSLTPLSPVVENIWTRNRPLYRLLTLVDAIRMGRARERGRARQILERDLRSRTETWRG